MLAQEQIYLDILFSRFSSLNLNGSPTAGSTLGFKHKPEFGIKRSGLLNPMAGRHIYNVRARTGPYGTGIY
jgi:hypothetical protein